MVEKAAMKTLAMAINSSVPIGGDNNSFMSSSTLSLILLISGLFNNISTHFVKI
jgi:hypothetical protein